MSVKNFLQDSCRSGTNLGFLFLLQYSKIKPETCCRSSYSPGRYDSCSLARKLICHHWVFFSPAEFLIARGCYRPAAASISRRCSICGEVLLGGNVDSVLSITWETTLPSRKAGEVIQSKYYWQRLSWRNIYGSYPGSGYAATEHPWLREFCISYGVSELPLSRHTGIGTYLGISNSGELKRRHLL